MDLWLETMISGVTANGLAGSFGKLRTGSSTAQLAKARVASLRMTDFSRRKKGTAIDEVASGKVDFSGADDFGGAGE